MLTVYEVLCVFGSEIYFVRGGADKSLVRTGSKKATANKLGIYSTYSQRSSVHFSGRFLFSNEIVSIQFSEIDA